MRNEGGGFAAFLEEGILVSSAFPSRGRCPAGAACIVIGIFAPSPLYPLPQTRPYHFLFKGRII